MNRNIFGQNFSIFLIILILCFSQKDLFSQRTKPRKEKDPAPITTPETQTQTQTENKTTPTPPVTNTESGKQPEETAGKHGDSGVQPADNNQTDRNSIITVTGTRRRNLLKDSTITTEVITRKDIDDMGARDLSQTLGNVPGIQVKPAAAGERGQTVQLQGLSSQSVLILVDGQRTTGRFSGSIDLTRFKAEDIERIEIVKGASSALYGSDAIAGVINIITKEAKEPLYAEFRTQGGTGSPQYYGPYMEFRNYASVGVKQEKISTIFTVGWHKGEGYDLTKDATQGPRNGRTASNASGYNPYPYGTASTTAYFLATRVPGYTPPLESTSGSAFNDMNLSNKTVYRATDDLVITGQFYYRYLDQSAVDATPPRTVYDRRNKTHDFMGALNMDYALTQKVNFNLNANYSRFQDLYTTDQRKSDELDSQQRTDNAVSEFRSRMDYKFSESHVTSVGAETLHDRISSARISPDCKRSFPNFCIDDFAPGFMQGQTVNGNAARFRNAFYIQDEWRISDKPRIQIVPGVRYDNDSIYGGQMLPKLAIRYDVSDKFRFRAANGLGYRAPSFQDLYFNFLNPGVGYRVAGNPNLKPELSRSYNFGWEWDITKRIWYSTNLFHNDVDNLIGFRTNPVRDPSGLQIFQTSNYQKASTQGIESSINFRILDQLSAGTGYTYTETRDELTNLPLEGRGPHRWNFNIRAEEKKTGLSLSVFAVVFGKQAYYCVKNPFWCNPDLPDSLSGIETAIAAQAAANMQKALGAIPGYVSDYCTEKNLSYCTTNPTYGSRMVNPHTNLNLRISQKFFGHFQWFIGVDNILDSYDLVYNPQRPRFYYFGLDGKFSISENDKPAAPKEQPQTPPPGS
ncbi:TonB-dependent receptor (plasmid) [Leptospira kobayashii]|uniref:TonB-dependent receptor n=1 Tax=Leptospira kobayashii TaxID=1917830 RepID=A0ABN6KL85_9LEPT|nr:TonB-dependent receptor [Leptospira kobayashii]BDA80941.1 TonB-dependent receptor [Leptospira kobayashii]